jgi:hypothetical protein
MRDFTGIDNPCEAPLNPGSHHEDGQRDRAELPSPFWRACNSN